MDAIVTIRSKRVASYGKAEAAEGVIIMALAMPTATGVAHLVMRNNLIKGLANEKTFGFGLNSLVLKYAKNIFWTGAGVTAVGTFLWAMAPTPAAAAGIAEQYKSPQGLQRFFDLPPERQLEVARWDGEIMNMLIQLSAALSTADAQGKSKS